MLYRSYCATRIKHHGHGTSFHQRKLIWKDHLYNGSTFVIYMYTRAVLYQCLSMHNASSHWLRPSSGLGRKWTQNHIVEGTVKIGLKHLKNSIYIASANTNLRNKLGLQAINNRTDRGKKLYYTILCLWRCIFYLYLHSLRVCWYCIFDPYGNHRNLTSYVTKHHTWKYFMRSGALADEVFIILNWQCLPSMKVNQCFVLIIHTPNSPLTRYAI